MKAVTVGCPHCGAKLDVPPGVASATCSYCGTVSRIQQRTGFFERAAPPPADPAQSNLPVVRQPHSRKYFAAMGLMVALPMVGSLVFAFTGAGVGGAGGTRGFWNSDYTLTADINGDGVTDAIGSVRVLRGGTQYVHLVTYDGRTGNQLWRSEALGEFSGTVYTTLALAGDTLLYTDQLGHARGFDVRTGSPLWEATLGERLAAICRTEEDGDGTVRLNTQDDRWLTLTLADGSLAPGDDPDPCQPLPTEGEMPLGDALGHHDRWAGLGPRSNAFEGIDMDMHAQIGEASFLALGSKSPGTRVPMALRYERVDDGDEEAWEVAWMTEIPGVNPLTVREGKPEYYAVVGEVVIVPYLMSEGGPRVAAISLGDGSRRWDTQLAESFITSLGGITAAGDRAFVRVSDRLDAIDLVSGELQWSVGNMR